MKSITIILVLLFAGGLVYSQDIPKEGLVGYWKLDEGEGFMTADSSGFGADGELMETADWVEGYMGNAIECDGEAGYVECGGGEGQFDIEDELTLSVWVNQWDIGNGEHNMWLGKGDHSYAIKHWSGNMYEFFIFSDTWYSVHAPIDSAHLYEWHHFAGTFDTEYLKFYIDGVLAATDTLLDVQIIALSEHTINIGRNSENTDRFLLGQIDEAMIYNAVLTDEQIMQLYNIKSAVMRDRTVANEFRLQQNYPNPFNPVTTISYTIPATLPVTLRIYDTLGKEVQTVVNEQQSLGTHSVSFDASALPSGIYFYKLQAGDLLVEMKKMMLVK